MRKTRYRVVLISALIIIAVLSLTACFDVLKTDIANCEVSLDAAAYQYTGYDVYPAVEVKYVERILKEDTDYSLVYSDNVEIGKGRVKVLGRGNFKGEVIKEFDIVDDLDNYDPNINVNPNALTYVFSAADAKLVSGKLTQKVDSVDDVKIPIVEKKGYDFLYWTYEGERANFADRSSLPQGGGTFVAVFSIVTYTIEYVLGGGTNSPLNKDEYTVEDYFELQDAQKIDMQFVGWFLDGEFDERIHALNGIAEDLTLYAKFVDFDPKTINYVVPSGAHAISSQTVYPGEKLESLGLTLSADGSKKLVWYLDEDMTVRHNLRIMPNEDVTLYARWEDKLYAGFLDRGWSKLGDIKKIDSYDDLLAYVEFVYFYGVTDKNKRITITYVWGKDNIQNQLSKAHDECTFPQHLTAEYAWGDNYCSYYLTDGASASIAQQATLSASSKQDYYPQINDVFSKFQSSRKNDFDDFVIDDVELTYDCSTSDQLFYVLSHGYKPTPVSGSSADTIYRQLKSVARKICDDDMSDLEKTRAIFDWLIINVYYDNAVAYPPSPLKDMYKYDAFYIEGVINGAAVCDGLSKAYSALCSIEGIDCVRVTGKLKNAAANQAGHAWNKVQIMGEWFLTDATWGNGTLAAANGSNPNDKSFYEFVTREYFLFTDGVRSEVDNYYANEYTYYVADTQYNFYSGFKMRLEFTSIIPIVGVSKYTRTFDLYIDGDKSQDMSCAEELSYVLEYIDRNSAELNGLSFNVKFGERVKDDIYTEAVSIYQKRVGPSARINAWSLIGIDGNGYIEKGKVVTMVFSLPQ